MILKNKNALITGGSRGIGKAVAEAFLREGARVTVTARTEEDVRRTVRELNKDNQLLGMTADVSRPEDVRNLMDRTLAHFGRIDILVNAAAVQHPIGSFLAVDIHQWIANIHVNLIGTALCCKAAVSFMAAEKKGKIINFSGGGATASRPNFSAYGVSKAAIVRLTEILADELKPCNIQVNAVAPGVVKTKMTEEILRMGPEGAGEEYEILRSRTLSGYDPPQRAAELVCYLASEESNAITGKLLSAVWDPWQEWKGKKTPDLNEDMYVLRRIDGKRFVIKND